MSGVNGVHAAAPGTTTRASAAAKTTTARTCPEGTCRERQPSRGSEAFSEAAADAALGLRRPVERLQLVEAPAGALGDARQRRLDHLHGEADLAAQPLVHAAEQRAAARKHDPSLAEVGRELRRRTLERVLDGVD